MSKHLLKCQSMFDIFPCILLEKINEHLKHQNCSLFLCVIVNIKSVILLYISQLTSENLNSKHTLT